MVEILEYHVLPTPSVTVLTCDDSKCGFLSLVSYIGTNVVTPTDFYSYSLANKNKSQTTVIDGLLK